MISNHKQKVETGRNTKFLTPSILMLEFHTCLFDVIIKDEFSNFY